MSIPARLLGRLDDLGQVLERRGDALALIGVGSVGRDVARLDDHSDLDFFVVVQDEAKPAYLASTDWLEELGPVVFSFANTADGRKVLYADGLFAEYAVFTLAELRAAAYSPGRVVWQREDAPAGLAVPTRPVPPVAVPSADALSFHVNEALANLYVGMHRELRGERLSATRFIQGYALDQVLTILDATDPGRSPRQDVFVLDRAIEDRYGATTLPLDDLLPGYGGNRHAALAILDWLEAHAPQGQPVNPAMAAVIRDLAGADAQSA